MKCYICYYSSENEDEIFICENCDEYYCEDCSYLYANEYSPQGNFCYHYLDQNVRTKNELIYLRRKNTIDEISK